MLTSHNFELIVHFKLLLFQVAVKQQIYVKETNQFFKTL